MVSGLETSSAQGFFRSVSLHKKRRRNKEQKSLVWPNMRDNLKGSSLGSKLKARLDGEGSQLQSGPWAFAVCFPPESNPLSGTRGSSASPSRRPAFTQKCLGTLNESCVGRRKTAEEPRPPQIRPALCSPYPWRTTFPRNNHSPPQAKVVSDYKRKPKTESIRPGLKKAAVNFYPW